MLSIVAALTAHGTRQLTELGALCGLLGGVALVVASVQRFRRSSLIVAGGLLVVGFALIIYGLHFGLNPYAMKP